MPIDIYYSEDMNQVCNKILCIPLQPEGWQVHIAGRPYTFRGSLVAFLGDTPAVNMVGGFKEGVGMAMRKCRHCMTTYDQIQTKVICL